jgi:hypothetical protein
VNPNPPGRPRWWQWPTVLSLDAPVIVLLWQQLFGRVGRVVLHWPHAFVLGSSVWLAYAADRWFEGWRVEPARMRTARHRFYQRWRWPVAGSWIAVLAVDVTVALVNLSRREFVAGAVLLIPVLLYLLSHQLAHRHHRWRVPKEICIAVLLGGGAALFVVAGSTTALRAIAIPLGLFVALCFANVALISAWEHEVDLSHGQISLARQFRGAAAFSRVFPWLIFIVAVAIGAAMTSRPTRQVVACAAMSAALLGVIDRLEPNCGWQASRVMADAVLLTPIVAWLLP